MDYFNYVHTNFQGLERVSDIAVYALLFYVRKLLDFIKNICICVLKMKEGLTGLERHEGE